MTESLTARHERIRRALDAHVEHEHLALIARGLGFDRGIAPQIAAQAVEMTKHTGASPVAYIESLSRLIAAESTHHAIRRWNPRRGPLGPLSRARSACRHAVQFARRVLLRR